MTEASTGPKQGVAAAAGFSDDWRGFLKVISLASGAPFMGSMLTIVLPILPNISKDIGGADDPLLGRLVVAMPTMGIVVGGIIAGFLLTRYAARHVLLTAITLFGLVGGAGVVLDGPALLGSRFLIGAIAVCIAASSTTLIGDFIPPDRRPRVLGLQTASASLIGIIMMNLSGMLSDAFGWRASFLLFPAMAAVVIVFGLALIPLRQPAAAAAASGAGGEKLSQWSLLKPLIPLYLLLMVLHTEAFTTNSQASFVLAADGVIDAAGRARMMSINQTMIVIAAISYPFTRALLGPRWIPALLFTCMTVGLLILGTQENLVIVGLGLAILGISNGTLFPHQSTLILARAHPAVRGRAVGLISSNQFFADSLNPFILAPLIAAVGLKNAIATVGLMCGAGLLMALIYGVRASNPPAPAAATTGAGH